MASIFDIGPNYEPIDGCECPMCRKYRESFPQADASARPLTWNDIIAQAIVRKMRGPDFETQKLLEDFEEAKRRIAQLEALLDEATTQNEVLEAQLLELGTAMNEEACAARELSRQLLELSSSANMAAHALSDLANDAYPRA